MIGFGLEVGGDEEEDTGGDEKIMGEGELRSGVTEVDSGLIGV